MFNITATTNKRTCILKLLYTTTIKNLNNLTLNTTNNEDNACALGAKTKES
jgi:hypothetical protein